MPFLPVILWTDALVFLLVGAAVFYFSRIRHDRNLARNWKRAFTNPAGMASAVVLGAFIVIGLLDSLHFRPRLEAVVPAPTAAKDAPKAPAKDATKADAKDAKKADKPIDPRATQYAPVVYSLLDVITKPINLEGERTYSEPLDWQSFVKETRDDDGKIIRDFQRLKVGAAHLKDPATEWKADILQRTAHGIAAGLIMTLIVGFVVVAIRARRLGQDFATSANAVARGQTDIPWRAAFLALLFVLTCVGLTAMLGTHYHILGTDKVGKSLGYLSLKSIRTALVIGTLTTLITLPFALFLGIAAGYFRGWIDDIVQYVYTTLNSIPSVLLIAAAVLLLQVYIEVNQQLFPTTVERADVRLFFLCVILGLTSWTGLCRLLRGETLKLRELEYIQAAQAFGVSNFRIIWRHILPNVMHLVLISVVMEFSGLVLAEAVLSYVGIGVDPTMNSFGTMINAARMEMSREPIVWWSLASAFCFMFIIVLSANLFADAVRDAFDPRARVR
jgi:peptide/nickel transport system permease protein